MTRPPSRWSVALLAAALFALAPAAAGPAGAAEQGVSAARVLFGQSAAFSGPAGDLGRNMRLGIEAAFAEINEKGGVHGRRLELRSLDDAYEPEAAIANTAKLAKEEGVFALIGAVGTPTSRSAVPVAASAGVPYVAPFTGAEFLRDPKLRIVVNLRASYYQETEEMVARLIGDLGIERIAVLYQDDTFGRAGYRGVMRALERRGLKPAGTGVYPRNTTAVKTALLDLRSANPGAVVLVGAYRPVAAFIAWARHIGFDPVFMTISFVGSNALRRELGSGGAGVFVTQVVPFPTADRPPVLKAYRRALARHAKGGQPGFVSLEGYLAGRLAIAALRDCGPQPDRACFLDRLRRKKEIDLDGFKLRFGASDNQGSDSVFLTVIDRDGRYRPVETLRDSAAQ
ncbi:MAG: ABC transporter substrate-binding protein [Rhodospirillaceae bacterium]|nr:ABC transporter substrate-binding protein [Rhodospirillaceae bacterium]MDE0619455.1 ABC transporter substrate-binding protein [Rhodospirillaceae bacterium]